MPRLTRLDEPKVEDIRSYLRAAGARNSVANSECSRCSQWNGAVAKLREKISRANCYNGTDGYDTVQPNLDCMCNHQKPALIDALCGPQLRRSAAVRFAREHDISNRRRGGGHSAPGQKQLAKAA